MEVAEEIEQELEAKTIERESEEEYYKDEPPPQEQQYYETPKPTYKFGFA